MTARDLGAARGREPAFHSAAGVIPPDVLIEVADALGLGDPSVTGARRIGGGCISPAARLDFPGRDPVFLKWARSVGPSGFGVEARGLAALSARGALRVPSVLAVGEGGGATRGWLALELVHEGAPDSTTDERLGRGLAALHAPIESATPGWEEDGWIGSLPQANRWEGAHPDPRSWPDFWRDLRLVPQWRAASARFDPATHRRWDRLIEGLPDALRGWESDGIALLHGDLWSGNVLTDGSGDPVLVDPAAYRGHREVDLAMMELFGGFAPRAFAAYRESRPLLPGYEEARRDVYQLYPLLVHVNLFGSAYVDGARARIERLTSGWR